MASPSFRFKNLEDKFKSKRIEMVEKLTTMGITDQNILNAVKILPRDIFIDAPLAGHAYDIATLPIGHKQSLSSPYTICSMLQYANISKHDIALEVGTGTGYQAAILSLLVEKLYTVEMISSLSNKARHNFNQLNLANIVSFLGDGAYIVKKYGPFDLIIVAAVAPELPTELSAQLADNGRMIVPVEKDGQGRIHVIRKKGGKFFVTVKEECSFVPLVGKDGYRNK
ncbi:MAG: protein-L-isoaspartate(D-aspartate) O-methyltransferase [Nitrospinota bacterium]